MTRDICSIDDCDRPKASRGWCRKHYQRWQRNGDPLVRKRSTSDQPLLERILNGLDVGDCWEWTGWRLHGHGIIGWKYKRVFVHRAIWEELVGPIPDGMVIDHLCRNRACANPDHLEPVTLRENILRGEGITSRHSPRTNLGAVEQ